MSFYEKLEALQIKLPAVAAPAAAYVMYAQTGNTVFISGHIAKQNGQVWVGQLGKDISTETGKAAARAVAIDLIATLQSACGGDLNRVQRIVKLLSLVNSTSDFTEQHQRGLRVACGSVWRAGQTCPFCLWCGTDPARCLCRN